MTSFLKIHGALKENPIVSVVIKGFNSSTDNFLSDV